MYGIIGKMIAREGARDELIAILLDGTRDMPGCLSYVIARDQDDGNALWITEAWDSRESHQASLSLESVQQAIQKGRPLRSTASANGSRRRPLAATGWTDVLTGEAFIAASLTTADLTQNNKNVVTRWIPTDSIAG